VPDWFAALVRRMWVRDAATHPVLRDVLLGFADGDSDATPLLRRRDLRKLSLREHRHGDGGNENDKEENDFAVSLSVSDVELEV
jgi:hypothetical protein